MTTARRLFFALWPGPTPSFAPLPRCIALSRPGQGGRNGRTSCT